jgi:hypothetical protein
MESEFMKSIVPVIAAVVGGLFTYLSIYFTQRLTRLREQRQYLQAKLERAYTLAQSLYEGHNTEITKLKASENVTATEWMQLRKHPGEIMSELKMIVGMYFPALESALDNIDKHHQALKATFLNVDEEMQRGVSTWTLRNKAANDMKIELKHLGQCLTNLKQKIASQVGKL